MGAGSALFATWEENDATTGTPQSAGRPTLAVSPVAEYSLFAFWHEAHAVTGKTQTAANLLLPELSSPGALDFNRLVRIDSSPPVVQDVVLSGDVARVMSTALSVQTIDVYNQASLTQGSYKLVYGGSYETTCIDWNAPAAGTGSMKVALESIAGLALRVSVTKDTSAFHDGHRFIVTFVFPTMGLRPLRVKDNAAGDGCSTFTCLPSAVFLCTLRNLVRANQNADVTYRPGVLDALVRFTRSVVVASGTPKLVLETGAVDAEATYTPRGALQEFDVGTDAPSPIVRSSFRLAYGDVVGGGAAVHTTDCIDVPPKDEDAVQELYSKLKDAIPELVTIGISSISRRSLRNGYRYSIWLRNSPDLLDLVPADASLCPQFAGRTQTIDISANAKILQGEFQVQFGDSKSGCIPWNIRARGGGSLALSSLQSILGGAVVPGRTIPLQVTKDPSAFAVGHRYFVDFMRLSDARQDLLVLQAPACVAFACDDGVGNQAPCAGLKLAVNADYKARRAVSETLSFRYLVQTTDNANVLAYSNPSTALSGNILRASKTPSVVASLALPSPAPPLQNAVGAQVAIVSENDIPTVLRVYSSSLNGEYTVGDEIVLLLQFSGVVQVQGVPILELNSNGIAAYFAGTGTDTLEFRYKVAAGEGAAKLDYASQHSLVTPNANTYIRYGAAGDGQPATLDVNMLLPALASLSSLASSSSIVVDTATPTIVSVSSLNPNTAAEAMGYGVGDVLLLTVEFSKEVTVFGAAPTMQLDSSAAAVAAFTFGSHRQLIDVGVYATYPLTSGQFAVNYGEKQSGCVDFNDANSNAASSFQSRLLEIDAVRAIGIVSVTLLAVKNGHRFEVVFKMAPASAIPLAIEPIVSDVCAPLLPAADPVEKLLVKATDTVVVFRYEIREGDMSADLDSTGAALSLPGADSTILRGSRDPTLAADLTLPPIGSVNRLKAKKNLAVDGSPIRILDIVSDSAGGTYGVAFPTAGSPAAVSPGEILFHLVFSRPVRVEGSPTVELATGSLQPNGVFIANRFAVYVNQPQSDQVAFLYHIQEGDVSANLAFPNANVLANAKIYSVSTSSSHLVNLALPRLTVSGATTIRIDASSVPTTVKISSPHGDGTFGAGEAIDIQVTFSKSVVMQTGLNQNQDYFARFPTSTLFQGNIYVLWTEWERFSVRSKSYLYLAVFSSATLERVPTAALPAVINRIPDSFIERATLTVWDTTLYAAWDENGLIYCARYNGVAAVTAWTLIPNKGLNRNLALKASEPFLLVHNLLLVLLWREIALVEGGGGLQAGQIRVALPNDDRDAPRWIFHDGNQLSAGLNRNPQCDAKEPTALVFKGTMFVTWVEARLDDAKVYDVVIARRNVINRDASTWRYLEALASTKPAYAFISSYRPRLAVRRRGFEDVALLLTWYRDTAADNVTEVATAVVSDSSWEASVAVAESVPYTLDGSRNALVSQQINTNQLEFTSCGDALYAVWMQSPLPARSSAVAIAVLGATGSVYHEWKTLSAGSLNHNQVFDALDADLVCSSTATAASSAEVGLFWTEFDGFSTKLRFRHQKVPPRSAELPHGAWEEVSSGTPLLKMFTGTTPPGNAVNVDRSGTEAYVLNFVYIVQQGDSAQDIDVFDLKALILNGATIRDYLGQLPDYTLFPRSSDPRSLSFNKDINVDTTPPLVADVTAETLSGEYGVGQRLLIQVVFTMSVTVVAPAASDLPVLYLRSDELHFLGATLNPAKYVSGSGTKVLTFEYFASELDYCEKLDYFNENSLVLLGESKIRRTSTFLTTDALLTLPPPRSQHSLSGNRAISIKAVQPRVLQVTAVNADGTYHPGDKLTVQIVFSLPVVVVGSPILRLATGREGATATFVGGNETRTLSFSYSVAVGDQSARLDVIDDRGGNLRLNYVKSLDMAGHAQILRLSTNPSTYAATTLPAPGSPGSFSLAKALVIDSIQPAIVNVRSSTNDGTYDIGDEIELLVEFSQKVVVVGTPEIVLNVAASSVRTAGYRSGSGTTVLRFVYVPALRDETLNIPLDNRDRTAFILRPLLAGREITMPPARVLCAAETPTLDADLTMPRPGVPLQANSVYSPGQKTVVSVVFTSVVLVQGAPRLKLNANALLPVYASYTQGSGSSVLQFQYVVVNGDSCSVLDPGSLSFNYRIEISSTPPSVTRVYAVNPNAPTLGLQMNAGVRTAAYASGDGSRTLIFTYRVQNDDAALKLEYASQTALAGTLFALATTSVLSVLEFVYTILAGDRAGELDYTARDSLSLSGTSSICVDPSAPRVTSVSSLLANGIYGAGQVVDLTISFSEPVLFTRGEPRLRLSVSSANRAGSVFASYIAGAGTITLVFRLTTQDGDMALPLEYDGVDALSMDTAGGRIFAAVGGSPTFRSATMRLPPPRSTGSLSNNRDIRIDTLEPPRVLAVTSATPDGIYTTGNLLPGSAEYVSGSGSASLAFQYVVRAGDHVDRLDYTRCPDAERRAPVRREWSKLVICSEVANALQLGAGGSIKRLATTPSTDALLDLPEVSSWPKLRFSTSRDDYLYIDQVEAATDIPVSERAASLPTVQAVGGLLLANLSRFGVITVDENPPMSLTESAWLNPEGMSVVYTSTSVVVRTTGVPNGAYGPFPNIYNPHSVKAQNHVFTFPRQPVLQAKPTALAVDTPVGVMINGVPFFASSSAVYGSNVMASSSPALLLMDKCNGLVDSGGDYRYYASPDCLLRELKADERNKPSPLIGYAFDGFPLYGPYNEDGALSSDLDECNGRIGYDGTYRYHVFTSKAVSTFVAGETLDIVVQWSWPVKVDVTGGRPSIAVANSTQLALFDASRSTPLASVFLYKVESDVGLFAYDYRSVVLLNGATIRRLAVTPTLNADLRLVNAETIPRFASKHQLVRNVKMTMRGLYHPEASDLQQLQVFHENPTSGVGFDYAFQDLTGAKNLAADGGATALQSSTSASCFASEAIDGRVKGYVSDQTEFLPAVVQTLRVDSNDAVSSVDGSFTLVFTARDGTQLVTSPINHNAVAMIVDEDPKIENLGTGKAESIQAKLSALPGMPRVFVTRSPADASQSPNGAFAWSITFLDNPKLYHEGTLPLRVGTNLVCGGTGVVGLVSPSPGDDVDRWNYLERDDRKESVSIGKLSMLPFWVMLFEDSSMMDFESFQDAYDAAIWRERVEAAPRPVVTVNPPLNTKARYVRVIVENTNAYLTLAESGERSQHGEGGISDWVLTITDMSGATRTYFMDIQARIKSLPRHGKLYIGAQEAAADDLDRDGNSAVDSLEASVYLSRFLLAYDALPVLLQKRAVRGFLESYNEFGGIEILRDPSERAKLLPIACDARCLADIGIDPYFYRDTEIGDVGAKTLGIAGTRTI
ncbi:hypothetical protein PybrP1_003174, partial [[Pythium] brassicae (nom. inval.)]